MKFSTPKRPKKGASELKVYPCKRRFSVYSMPKLPEKDKDKYRDFCVNVCWCVFCVIQNINKNSLSSPIIEYM